MVHRWPWAMTLGYGEAAPPIPTTEIDMPQNADEPGQAQKLVNTIWKTQGARFTAQRRLAAMHRWSLGSIAIASLYVVGLSLIPWFFEIGESDERLLGLVTVLSAVGILVMSLLEAGERYEVRSERVHDCGLALGALMGELDVHVADARGTEGLTEYRQRYDAILKEHKENHERLDHRQFLASRRKDFGIGWWHARAINIAWSARTYWRFAVLIILPPLAGALILK